MPTRVYFVLAVILLSPVWLLPALGSDEPALLAAIQAHPDEDTPRLMYADWLDEHGKALRAEFIRLQIALSRMDPNDAEYAKKRVREKELLKNAEATALPAYFKDSSPISGEQIRIKPIDKDPAERAILDSIASDVSSVARRSAYAQYWRNHGKEDVAELIYLLIDDYSNGGTSGAVARRARIAELTKKTEGQLDPFFFTFPRADAVPIYRRGFLEELRVPSQMFQAPPAKNPLDHAPFLRKLSVLGYGVSADTNVANVVASLVASDVTARLETLNLRELALSPDQIDALSAKLKSLRHLAIGPHSLRTEPTVRLLRTPLAERLLSLELFSIAEGNEARLREELNRLFARGAKLEAIDDRLFPLLPEGARGRVKTMHLALGALCREVMYALVERSYP